MLKLTNTPKAANGTSTPKAAKEATPKSAKPKKAKAPPKAVETPEVVVPKEPELTDEEKRAKKEVNRAYIKQRIVTDWECRKKYSFCDTSSRRAC